MTCHSAHVLPTPLHAKSKRVVAGGQACGGGQEGGSFLGKWLGWYSLNFLVLPSILLGLGD